MMDPYITETEIASKGVDLDAYTSFAQREQHNYILSSIILESI